MCMRVNAAVKGKKPNKDGYCQAWKVIKVDNSSAFQRFSYSVGVHTTEIGYVHGSLVEKGFHCFLKRSYARLDLKDWEANEDYKIIKVYYKPEHVVAYGDYFNSPFCYKPAQCVVVSELTIKSLDKVRQ